jgi:hypothetical protein
MSKTLPCVPVDSSASMAALRPVIISLLLMGAAMPVRGNIISIGSDEAKNVNNLKEIALAMHNHLDVFNAFPAQHIQNLGTPTLSWRVSLLPFLGHQSLFEQFDLTKPWDHPVNLGLLPQMPEVFRSPADPAGTGNTPYVVGTGIGTIFEGATGSTISSITDGTSNTLLLGEAANRIPWTKPEDLAVTGNPVPTLGEAGFGSITPGFVPFAFADGSVGFLPNDIDAELLRQLFLKNDGGTIEDRPVYGYVVRPGTGGNHVPDVGSTAMLLVLALVGCARCRKR